MKLYRPTPFARRQLNDRAKAAIKAAAPDDYLVSIGMGAAGWTCLILSPELRLVADVYGAPSALEAFNRALATLKAAAHA